MSTFSRNPFDLLGDESEDVEIEQTPAPKVEAPQTTRKPVDKSRAQRGEARIRHEYPQRGGMRTVASTRTAPEEPRAPRDRNVAPRFQRRTEDGSEFPSRPRGEGRSRGSGERGRGGYRGRGRQFDRHSATGRVDSEKKETQGWGDATTAWEEGAKAAEAEVAAEAVETPAAAAAAPEETSAEAPAGETPAAPEVEVVKTLDEYLAEKAQKSLNVTLPEARKPNEGADETKWKNAVELEKTEEEEILFAGKEQTFRAKNKSKKEKVYVEIEQRFRGERPGRGRGGFERRGAYNSGAERGERRGGFRGGRTANGMGIEDESAFPTLGSK